MGSDAKPCPPAVEVGADSDCHGDAEALDQLRDAFQPTLSSARAAVSEQVQIHNKKAEPNIALPFVLQQ